MIEEIVYTSAPRGLKPGSRGFCTVASTPGMAGPLATLLESLSGYRHLVEPGSSTEGQNPTVYNHFKLRVGGRSIAILSRVADAGHDYSGRTNKLAHHIALTAGRPITAAGPVATQQHEGFHETTWSGEPRLIEVDRVIPEISNEAAACNYWNQITGDAGWGGVVAGRVAEKPSGDVWIIYPAGLDMLRLLGESFALLPAAKRWEVTYTTFFTKLPPGVECRIRCVVDGTAEASQARKRYELNVIDLCGPLGEPPAGVWTEVARTGQRPQPPKQQPPKQKPPKQQPLELQLDHPTDLEPAPVFGDDDQFELESPELQLSPSPLPPLLSAGGPSRGPRSGRRWMIAAAAVVVLLLIVIGLGSVVLLKTKSARRDLPDDVEQSTSSKETSDEDISDGKAEAGKPSLGELDRELEALKVASAALKENTTNKKEKFKKDKETKLKRYTAQLKKLSDNDGNGEQEPDISTSFDDYQNNIAEVKVNWKQVLANWEVVEMRANNHFYNLGDVLSTTPTDRGQELRDRIKRSIENREEPFENVRVRWNKELEDIKNLKDLELQEKESVELEDLQYKLSKLVEKLKLLAEATGELQPDVQYVKKNLKDIEDEQGLCITTLNAMIGDLEGPDGISGKLGELARREQDQTQSLESTLKQLDLLEEQNSISSLRAQLQEHRKKLQDIIADHEVEIELTNLLTKVLENSQENSNKPLGLDEPDDQRGSNDQHEPIDSRFELVPETAQLFLPRSKKQPLVMIDRTRITPTEIWLCTIDTLTAEEGEELPVGVDLLRVEIAESELKGSPSIDLKNNDDRYGNLLRHSILMLDIKEGDIVSKEGRIRFSKPRFAPAANLSNLPPQHGPQPPSRLNFSLEDSDFFPEASVFIRVASLGELKDPKPRDLNEATNAEGIFLTVPINKDFDINVKIKMERTRDDWQVSLTIADVVVKDVPELPPGVFSPPQPIGFQQNPQWPPLASVNNGAPEDKQKAERWNQFLGDVQVSWGNLLRDYETKPLFNYEVYIPLENKDGQPEEVELVIITSGPDGIDGGEQP